jgi:cyclophilin family peptidyl-prolyl cis-trans isomerase
MKQALLVPLALATLLLGEAAAQDKAAKKGPVVVMKTSMGTIKVELYQDKAPVTVKNFLAYVDAKHYDGTVFHRVIEDFMIQGGGFKKGISAAKGAKEVEALEKPTKAAIVNEAKKASVANKRGTIAMARTNDPDSATAQFFINVEDNDNLDPQPGSAGYCAFGRVIEGMAVVDNIKAVKTKQLFPGFRDVPVTDVVIESVRRAGK